MPQHRAREPRPDEIARFGHIALAVKEALAAKGWGVRQMNEACGKKYDATQMYQIVNCKSAPSPTWAAYIHKHLGVPMAQLRAKPLLRTEEAAQVAQAHARALPPPQQQQRVVGDVLQFAINSEGNARVRLDVVLPIKDAMPLLRTLLDQGFIMRDVQED